MPRRAKGPRLYFRAKEQTWYIRDGDRLRSTGCALNDRAGAERALAAYLGAKHEPSFGTGDPARVSVLDVLLLYARERAPATARPDIVASAIPHLSAFFAGRVVEEVTPGLCASYVEIRTSQPQARFKDPESAPRVGAQTARRELETLSAAIGYAYAERKLNYRVPVALPDKPPNRERWLTRSQAAALIWACLRAPFGRSRHIARFILIGIYTGTRPDAILRLRWIPNTQGGWIDLERGLIYRRGVGQAETTKRRTPLPISDRLAAHLRRWSRMGGVNVVEYEGREVLRIRRAFTRARIAAGLGEEVTPHILRHTFASWAVQSGVKLSLVAGALGTTERMVQQVYGHLAPEHLRDVVNSVSVRRADPRKRR